MSKANRLLSKRYIRKGFCEGYCRLAHGAYVIKSLYGNLRKGQLRLRSRFYTISHNGRTRNDNDSLKGSKESSAPNNAAQNPHSAADDPYSCVIAYDSTIRANKSSQPEFHRFMSRSIWISSQKSLAYHERTESS